MSRRTYAHREPLYSRRPRTFLWTAWGKRSTWISTGCELRSELPAHCRRSMHRCCPTQVGTCVLFPWKFASMDMSKTAPSTRCDRPSGMFHSSGMAPVAQLAAAAPIAPPQNLEAEESVLGAMMLSPGAIGAVSEVVDASDFYRESHGVIYKAALALYAKGEPVDAITLVDELEERGELEGAGGRVRIHELARLVPASANAAHYAKIVREQATRRGLTRVGGRV